MPPPADGSAFRPRAARALQGVMEAILLTTVVLSPWFFGAVEPNAEVGAMFEHRLP